MALWVLASFAAAEQPFAANQAAPAQWATRQGEPKLAPGVEAAIRAAHAAPPEFAADALITLVESGFIPDPQQGLGILEDAFRLAADAPEKMQLMWLDRGAIRTSGVRVSLKGLDGPSLRARSSAAMLALDPQRARRRFQQIRLPEKKFSCEDAFAWDPTVYYGAMSKMLASLSTTPEQRRFLEAHWVQFRSAGQVRPVAVILDRLLAVEGGAAAPLVVEFAGRLPDLKMDAREFTATFERTSSALASLAREAPEDARETLIRKTREWVVRASNNGVCAQQPYSVMSSAGAIREVDPLPPADRYNKEIAAHGRSDDRIDLAAEVSSPFPPVAAKAGTYSEDYLRFDGARRLLKQDAEEGKLSPRWKAEMEKHIAAVAAWKDPNSDDADPTGYYLEKAELFQHILGVRAPSLTMGLAYADIMKLANDHRQTEIAGRERVMLELAGWFEGPVALKVYRERRIRWFQGVWYLLSSPSENDPLLDDMLAASRHTVLHLYGALAQLKRQANAANRM
jgi:hypothetical protein